MIWVHDKHPFMPANAPLSYGGVSSNQTNSNIGQKMQDGVVLAAKMAGAAKMAYNAGMQLYNIGRAVAPFITPLLV